MATLRKSSAQAKNFPAQVSDLEDLVGYNLKRAYLTVSADFKRALGEDGFAPRVFSALSLTVQFPNITQSELARMLGIERSGLVAIVDELENRGFLERNAVPGDRRVQALMPTQAGQAAYAHARDVVRNHEAQLLGHLAPEEMETLLGLLRKIRRMEN
jgi:DNA-binding MarR family transcriptional regulator